MAEKKETVPTGGGHVQQSMRFRPDQVWWLEQEAGKFGVSVNALVRDMVDDARELYGVPKNIFDALEVDRQRMGLDRRGYIKALLGLRYESIIRGEVEEKASKGSKR